MYSNLDVQQMVTALFLRDEKTSPSEALSLLQFRFSTLALYRVPASALKDSIKLKCRRFVPAVPIPSGGSSLLVLGEAVDGSSHGTLGGPVGKTWLLLSPDQPPMQAEAFEDLLGKLKNLWTPRQTVFIEVGFCLPFNIQYLEG